MGVRGLGRLGSKETLLEVPETRAGATRTAREALTVGE